MPSSSPKQWIMLLAGVFALLMAYIGIILPGIPGTPFVLLALYFFMHSSPKLYGWMMKQRIFRAVAGKQFSGGLKAIVIIQIWISLGVAAYFFFRDQPIILISLLVIGVLLSAFLLRLKI